MIFGNYDCAAVELGDFFLDGGAMFGVVPKMLWEKKIPADDNNLIPILRRSHSDIGPHSSLMVHGI